MHGRISSYGDHRRNEKCHCRRPPENGIEDRRDQRQDDTRRHAGQQGRALPAPAQARNLKQFRGGLTPLQVRQSVRGVRQVKNTGEPSAFIDHRQRDEPMLDQ